MAYFNDFSNSILGMKKERSGRLGALRCMWASRPGHPGVAALLWLSTGCYLQLGPQLTRVS